MLYDCIVHQVPVLAWIGYPEILLILLLVLLLFGGAKLPKLARNLGKGMKAFKDEVKDVKGGLEDSDKPDDASAAAGKKKE